MYWIIPFYLEFSVCLKSGYKPSWRCEDWFSEVWDMSSPEKHKIESGGYSDTCGAPLQAGEPTSTYQAKKMHTTQGDGLSHPQGERIYHIPVAK